MVTAEIKRTAKKHEDWLHQHTNLEAIQLLDNSRAVRRLKRLKSFELVQCKCVLVQTVTWMQQQCTQDIRSWDTPVGVVLDLSFSSSLG
jgi:hypothetical protein